MNMDLLKLTVIVSLLVILGLMTAIAWLQTKIYKYKRKVYFIKRDKDRVNELLWTTKDGYFCFIYPDEKLSRNTQKIMGKCSRRLAVLLDLKNGTTADFNEVCEAFYKDDAQLLKKYVSLLQQDGLAFEDMLSMKGGKRFMCVYGNRIQSADGNSYGDIIWFRDVSAEAAHMVKLENEKNTVLNTLKQYENMIDGIDTPVWLRDENLRLAIVNKKYVEYTGKNTKTDVLRQNTEITKAIPRTLASTAQKTKKIQKKPFKMVRSGNLYHYVLYENPYFTGDTLDQIGTVGYLIDHTELENAKLNFELNQNSHLEILGVLGTAFAIFDEKTNLYFYNTSFRQLWNLDVEFLEKKPSYMQFIETIQQRKMLPSAPDFKAFKNDEMSVFSGLWKPREDMLHLPDGRTIHRFRMPHPNGVIFAFEDVSDRLAVMRRLNDLTEMQQGILDNLTDAVIIFGPNQRLKFYNRAYLKLWSLDYDKMQDEPKMEDIIAYQKLFFSNIPDWNNFRQTMFSMIMEGRKFTLTRDDNAEINVSPQIFYDGSVMLTYSIKPCASKTTGN